MAGHGKNAQSAAAVPHINMEILTGSLPSTQAAGW
jgi:hypothetical protein